MAVDLGQTVPDMRFGLSDELAHGGNLGAGPGGNLLHAVEHKDNPRLPAICLGYLVEQPVVIAFVLYDVTAQVENRQRQQLLLDQVQHIDDTPGTAIAVMERVNSLELVVADGHFDQWIGVVIQM